MHTSAQSKPHATQQLMLFSTAQLCITQHSTTEEKLRTSRCMVLVTAPFFMRITFPWRVATARRCSTSNKPAILQIFALCTCQGMAVNAISLYNLGSSGMPVVIAIMTKRLTMVCVLATCPQGLSHAAYERKTCVALLKQKMPNSTHPSI